MAIYRNNDFDNLEQLMLGSFYTPDYFSWIKNAKVRDPLIKISEEINEDLDFFEQVLKQYGCDVVRPNVISVDEFREHYEQGNGLLSPPLQPRNKHAVIGNQLFEITTGTSEINSVLKKIAGDKYIDISKENSEFYKSSMKSQMRSCYQQNTNTWYSRQKYNQLAGSDWPSFEMFIKDELGTQKEIIEEINEFRSDMIYNNKDLGPIEGPNILFCNDEVIVDTNEYCDYETWLSQYLPDRRIRKINTGGGHTDGCFSVLNNHCIIGIDPLIDYSTDFPNHNVIPIPFNNYQDILNKHLVDFKNCHYDRWWVSGEEGNNAFVQFVDKYLTEWTGFVSETYFDVNVLSLNPNLVVIPNTNSDVPEKLKKQGIDSIVVPWRHRFFVDGGLHCITLDLRRQK